MSTLQATHRVAIRPQGFAAFTAGMKKHHRVTFYVLAAAAFALAGVFFGTYPLVSMRWLVIFAVIHALIFGTSAFVYAFKADHHPQKRRTMYFFGAVSILFSETMAGLASHLDDPSATVVLGLVSLFRERKDALFCMGVAACRRAHSGTSEFVAFQNG